LPFEGQKIAKNLTFFLKKLSFFSTKLSLAIFYEKNENFWQFLF